MSEAESHFHPCPGCQQAVECQLAIGDSDCGKLRCAACSQPASKPAVRGYFLCATGWICECGKVNGKRNDAHVESCPECGRSKPTREGQSPKPEPELPPEIEPTTDDQEEEAETCDNCGEDITPENPAMDFNGDAHCKDCYPICKDCEETLKPEGYFRCERCEEYLCEDCVRWCQCCEVYLCASHAGDHGT